MPASSACDIRSVVPWLPGSVVEYCDVKQDRVWWRTPARVIEDTDTLTVLWWPAGTRYQRPVFDDRRVRILYRPRDRVAGPLLGHGVR